MKRRGAYHVAAGAQISSAPQAPACTARRTQPEPSRQSRRQQLLWLIAPLVILAAAAALIGAMPGTLQLTTPAEPGVVRIPGPAHGIFPSGCKWRDVQVKGPGQPKTRPFWATEDYEYWDEARGRWQNKQPDACLVRGLQGGAEGWAALRNGTSPRTDVECGVTHCFYRNLWYNNGRFFLLVDGPAPVEGWKMTRNQDLNVLHVDDAAAFVDGLTWRVITGDTLLFDFVYFLHPTAIGHWAETLFPLFSILRREPSFAWPPQQFVLLHLKRVHLMEWVRAVMATTLGVPPDQDLPPIIMQRETPSVWEQILTPLEGYGPREWVCIERALVVRDTFAGGERTFLTTEDAQAFRARIYAQHGLPPPAPRQPVPRVITFQRKRANRRVINEEGLLELLAEFGQVYVAEFNASTPFAAQLAAMANTTVFVSVHTSNLANAQFLQPGSAVVELLQRHWVWDNLDRSFQVQTARMGDIHHWAWRARHRNQTVYIDARDGERFGNWSSAQCATEDCVEAHTNVDVVVNLDEVRALLESRLPLVFAGASVEEAALPWPPPD